MPISIPIFIIETKTKLKYVIKDKTFLVPHDFNGNLNLLHKKMKNINALIFSEDHVNGIYSSYNQPIVLTMNIRHPTFGEFFNQPIVLTSNIVHPTIKSDNYNITNNLPYNIKHLTHGYFFELP